MKKFYTVFTLVLLAAMGFSAGARPVNFKVDRAGAVAIGQYSYTSEKIELDTDNPLGQGDNNFELSGTWYMGACEGYEIVSIYYENLSEDVIPDPYNAGFYSFYYGSATSLANYVVTTKVADGGSGGGDTPVEPVKNEVNFKLTAGKAELWIYNTANQDYDFSVALNEGDNKIDVDKSTYYRIQAAEGYVLDEVLDNGTKQNIQENTFICPTTYVVVDGATATGEFTITASEKVEPVGNTVDFYLMPNSEASVYHYVFADDEYILDKELVQGSNEIALLPNMPYYIIAGKGLKFESVINYEDESAEIYFDKDFEDGRYVAIIPFANPSQEYVITTVDAGSAPVTGEIEFILAEGSKAELFVEGFDEPQFMQALNEGSNKVALETEINRYYIVPAEGFMLAKVLDADKKELTLSENPMMFPSNFLSINDNLSAVYEIYTSETNAIESIESADNAAAEYFDLQGRRVANPVKGGMYIRMAAGVASKVVVK